MKTRQYLALWNLGFALTAIFPVSGTLFAQPGSYDWTFNPGGGANGGVFAIELQPDGKILIAGSFTKIDQTSRNGVARLNADGSVDSGFNPGSGATNVVAALCRQPDAKVVIAGAFTHFNGSPAPRLARLNADGTRDPFFAVGGGADHDVDRCLRQPDGRLLIAGSFTNVQGVVRPGIARLHPDGSLDSSFNAGLHSGAVVLAIHLKADGRILIGGTFTNASGFPVSHIARLFSDGALDGSFNPGQGPNVSFFGGVMDVQTDSVGRLLVGGFFTNFNGFPRRGLARLASDGQLDLGFNPVSAPLFVAKLIPQANGSIVCAGIGDFVTNHVVRLDANGARDSAFSVTMSNAFVITAVQQDDGRILCGGGFTHVDGVAATNIVRLNSNFSHTNSPTRLDTNFNFTSLPFGQIVRSVAVQRDRKVIVTGNFVDLGGMAYSGVARLNMDGSVDTDFFVGDGVPVTTEATSWPLATIQSDGKILLYGAFWEVDGTPRQRVARLNPDGSLDLDFVPPVSGMPAIVYALADDVGRNRIYVGGIFGRQVLRLNNSDGSMETNFNMGGGLQMADFSPVATARTLALQQDGKLLVGGLFDSVNGEDRPSIVRVQTNGMVDRTLRKVTLASDSGVRTVHKILVQPDRKILLFGQFSSVNGLPRRHAARLLPDGSVDLTFVPGDFSSRPVEALLQVDGKIVVAGGFTNISGAIRPGLARLNVDGSLDTGFNPRLLSEGTPSGILSVALAPDGKIVLGGIFTTVNGVSRVFAARLQGERPLARLLIEKVGSLVNLAIPYYGGQRFTIEAAPDVIGPWTALLTNNYFPAGVLYLDGVNRLGEEKMFFRSRHLSP